MNAKWIFYGAVCLALQGCASLITYTPNPTQPQLVVSGSVETGHQHYWPVTRSVFAPARFFFSAANRGYENGTLGSGYSVIVGCALGTVGACLVPVTIPLDYIVGWRGYTTEKLINAAFMVTVTDVNGSPLRELPITIYQDNQITTDSHGKISVLAEFDSDNESGNISYRIPIKFSEWKIQYRKTGDAVEYSPNPTEITLNCQSGICSVKNLPTDSEGNFVLPINVVHHYNARIAKAFYVQQEEEKRQAQIVAEQDFAAAQKEEITERKAEAEKERIEKRDEASAFEDMMNCTYGEGNSICYSICTQYQESYNEAVANLKQLSDAEQLHMVGDQAVREAGQVLNQIPLAYVQAVKNVNCQK